MNTDARELMADLRDDHRKMSMVLNLLADQVEAMEADEDPDFELLDEIMRYMTLRAASRTAAGSLGRPEPRPYRTP
jgi:hemerythrin-like domain-containing protein